jgi:hypothetical protein
MGMTYGNQLRNAIHHKHFSSFTKRPYWEIETPWAFQNDTIVFLFPHLFTFNLFFIDPPAPVRGQWNHHHQQANPPSFLTENDFNKLLQTVHLLRLISIMTDPHLSRTFDSQMVQEISSLVNQFRQLYFDLFDGPGFPKFHALDAMCHKLLEHGIGCVDNQEQLHKQSKDKAMEASYKQGDNMGSVMLESINDTSKVTDPRSTSSSRLSSSSLPPPNKRQCANRAFEVKESIKARWESHRMLPNNQRLTVGGYLVQYIAILVLTIDDHQYPVTVLSTGDEWEHVDQERGTNYNNHGLDLVVELWPALRLLSPNLVAQTMQFFNTYEWLQRDVLPSKFENWYIDGDGERFQVCCYVGRWMHIICFYIVIYVLYFVISSLSRHVLCVLLDDSPYLLIIFLVNCNLSNHCCSFLTMQSDG